MNLLLCLAVVISLNSDVLIVAQSEHGALVWGEKKMCNFFNEAEAPIDFWNDVLSAVRDPKKYYEESAKYIKISYEWRYRSKLCVCYRWIQLFSRRLVNLYSALKEKRSELSISLKEKQIKRCVCKFRKCLI